MSDNDNNGNEFRDRELDALLGPLKEHEPSALHLQKWKSAVQKEIHGGAVGENLRPSSPAKQKWSQNYKLPLQLVAAMLVGFILGALLFKNATTRTDSQEWTQNLGSDATFERSHTNLN
jgi:hypothetical protein